MSVLLLLYYHRIALPLLRGFLYRVAPTRSYPLARRPGYSSNVRARSPLLFRKHFSTYSRTSERAFSRVIRPVRGGFRARRGIPVLRRHGLVYTL